MIIMIIKIEQFTSTAECETKEITDVLTKPGFILKPTGVLNV